MKLEFWGVMLSLLGFVGMITFFTIALGEEGLGVMCAFSVVAFVYGLLVIFQADIEDGSIRLRIGKK